MIIPSEHHCFCLCGEELELTILWTLKPCLWPLCGALSLPATELPREGRLVLPSKVLGVVGGYSLHPLNSKGLF